MSFRQYKFEAFDKKHRHARQFVYRLGLLLVAVATTLAAQTNVPDWNAVKALTAGTQVRITAGSRSIRGEIERTTDDVLVVTSGKGEETLSRQDIRRVAVKKPGHRGRNALIGLGIGTGTGLAVGAGLDAKSGPRGIFPDLGKVVFTPLGALIGTAFGVALPTGGWREVYKN